MKLAVICVFPLVTNVLLPSCTEHRLVLMWNLGINARDFIQLHAKAKFWF